MAREIGLRFQLGLAGLKRIREARAGGARAQGFRLAFVGGPAGHENDLEGGFEAVIFSERLTIEIFGAGKKRLGRERFTAREKRVVFAHGAQVFHQIQ